MNGDRQRYAILRKEFLNKNALDRPQIQYMKVRLVCFPNCRHFLPQKKMKTGSGTKGQR